MLPLLSAHSLPIRLSHTMGDIYGGFFPLVHFSRLLGVGDPLPGLLATSPPAAEGHGARAPVVRWKTRNSSPWPQDINKKRQ